MTAGETIFVSKTEQYWDKPYVMKRSDVYDTRSVILRVVLVESNKGDEFKAKLTDNNNFEFDGEVFVFHKNDILCDQNAYFLAKLGIWQKH